MAVLFVYQQLVTIAGREEEGICEICTFSQGRAYFNASPRVPIYLWSRLPRDWRSDRELPVFSVYN